MRLPWARRLALGASVLAAACGSSKATPGADPGTTNTVPTGPPVQFDPLGPLTAVPTQAIRLGVIVQGEDTPITLWLEGNYLDGSLSKGKLDTQAGHAQLVLQTPSQPATFTVHARTAGGSEARLDVTVGSQGFSTVILEPAYAGKRAVGPVVGSVFLQTSCAELLHVPLQDGASPTTATLGQPLSIASIPAGTRVSISLRMAYYARGCVDVDRLAPSATTDLASVVLLDRPLVLASSDLAVSLTFEPGSADSTAYNALLDAGALRAADAFFPAGAPQESTEAGTLLNAMAAQAPSAQQAAFAASRTQGGWDAAVAAWLVQRPPTLRSRAQKWLASAKAEALAPLSGHLNGLPAAGKATFLPLAWGAVGIGAATGVTAKTAFDWTADADDTSHLAGTVDVQPTALLTHAADVYAPHDVALSYDVPSAIAHVVDCAALATSLVGAGTSYPMCNAACTAKLCTSALVAKWKSASEASATADDLVHIAVNASGPATSNNNAEPTGFKGTWVGKIISATGTTGMKGTATAKL